MSIEFDFDEELEPGIRTDGQADSAPSHDDDVQQYAGTATENRHCESTHESSVTGNTDADAGKEGSCTAGDDAMSNPYGDIIHKTLFDNNVDVVMIIVDALLIVGLYLCVRYGDGHVFTVGLVAAFIYEFLKGTHTIRRRK